MKQLRLDEAIAYLKDDLGDASEPSYYRFRFYTKTMQFTKEEELWEAIGRGSMPEIEQLEGKELLDTLEALRSILHPTVRALLGSYTIDMVMPIHHNQIIIIILNYERIYISHQQSQFKSKLIILQG